MKISILGLYTFDHSIFDNMYIPNGAVKDTIVNEIILRCSDLELLYPDPVFMKKAIEIWSDTNAINFQKMFDTMNLEYNPIWNKDGTYTEETNTSGTTDNVSSVKGFNSDSWANNAKADGNTSGKITSLKRETGNIGVTTTQQMIKEEREISEFSFYKYIAESFKQEFCIMIY